MANETGPSNIYGNAGLQEAIEEIIREMVLETDHNLVEACNSVASSHRLIDSLSGNSQHGFKRILMPSNCISTPKLF
ncbi:hypothetical protein LOK49_LG12G00552 [Camellia lanceoleosa]|uniref:Uncharacterized protein n=1 Tax=Camellia lanceoleosa TaxID=1840588 RepID=A0ACC0FUD3_9ERIC|nr:hypothetical protein LOK49_LG12G00552 [Camellia lanceoleosa]